MISEKILLDTISNMIRCWREQFRKIHKNPRPYLTKEEKESIIFFLQQIHNKNLISNQKLSDTLYDDLQNIIKMKCFYFATTFPTYQTKIDNHEKNLLLHLIGAIFKAFYILQVYNKSDIKINEKQKKKINQSIKILKKYTKDENIKNVLNLYDTEINNINTKVLHSCFFNEFTIVIEYFSQEKTTNYQKEELSRAIMNFLFSNATEYKIYKFSETIKYKNFYLHRYTRKQVKLKNK